MEPIKSPFYTGDELTQALEKVKNDFKLKHILIIYSKGEGEKEEFFGQTNHVCEALVEYTRTVLEDMESQIETNE